MPLIPDDDKHLAQILAGTAGRDKGHQFERDLTAEINEGESLKSALSLPRLRGAANLVTGEPSIELLRFVVADAGISSRDSVKAYWLGGLATSGAGDRVLDEKGHPIRRSKSDILIEISSGKVRRLYGVSVKTCHNATPTNAQLYFTTASAFCALLRNNRVAVGDEAEHGLKMFCGDEGFRPRDMVVPSSRKSDPDRWFWEELPTAARDALEQLFSAKQFEITLILLKYAYQDDPYPPTYLLHQARKPACADQVEMAIYTIDDLVRRSCRYGGLELRPYVIRKGRFRADTAEHLAPRIGIVQMQRGGQKQHPTQLQFNLKAGYFYKI